MKAKNILWVALVGALLVALVLLCDRHRAGSGAVLAQADTNQAQSDNSIPGAANQTNAARQTTRQEPSPSSFPDGQGNAKPSVDFAQQIDRPIEFYGMVVDESGSAVIGANIRFIWAHLVAPETSFETNTLSDGNGMFSLNGAVGSTLNVRVSKEGYYPIRSLDQTSFSYSETYGSHPFQPQLGRPVVFHLRKKGEGVNLITSKQGMYADFPVKAPIDGTPVNVDMMQRAIGGDGQMQISQIKPDFRNWKQATNWSFTMTIPGGGFVQESDEFPFEAAESGYQPTVEFDFQRSQPGWATNLKADYYIEFGNPPRFGYLHVATSINMDEVRLTYAINPDGSRNLEPQ